MGLRVAAHAPDARGLLALHAEEFEVVFVPSPDASARRFAQAVAAERPDVPVVQLTDGAGPYEDAIRDALVSRARRRRLVRIDAGAVHPDRITSLVGRSPAMDRVRDLVARYAMSEAPVLLQGETGTGKELVARALHAHGPRHARPFVGINCAAIPAGLLESELFGHTRGAFTGAVQARFGLMATATGGTLLLDEIQSLPLDVQPKLLHALEDRSVRPLGSTREVHFDVRLISASNTSLYDEVRENRFRADLFYRLDILRLALPPLRRREGDVLELAELFAKKTSARLGRTQPSLSPAASEALLAHAWPGNVRELMHVMEVAVALCAGDEIRVSDLPEEIRIGTDRARQLDAQGATLFAVRRRHAQRVLAALGGNKHAAARVLGISRQRLYRLLSE